MANTLTAQLKTTTKGWRRDNWLVAGITASLFVVLSTMMLVHLGNLQEGNLLHRVFGIPHAGFCLGTGVAIIKVLVGAGITVLLLKVYDGIKREHQEKSEKMRTAFGNSQLAKAAEAVNRWDNIPAIIIVVGLPLMVALFIVLKEDPQVVLNLSVGIFGISIAVTALIAAITVMLINEKAIIETLSRAKAIISARLGRLSWMTQSTTTFDDLPASEQQSVIKKAQAAGIKNLTGAMKRAAVSDYERQSIEAENERKRLEKQTAQATGKERWQSRL